MMYGTIYRYNYTYNITARILIHSSLCISFHADQNLPTLPAPHRVIRPDVQYGEHGMILTGVS